MKKGLIIGAAGFVGNYLIEEMIKNGIVAYATKLPHEKLENSHARIYDLDIMNKDEEEQSILEMIEEFEDRIDYLDISKDKKKKLTEMCEEIKKETDENVREYLFNLLQKEID